MQSNESSPQPIRTVSSKVVYKNPWISIREDAIVHPGGREGIYGYVDSKDSVMVIAVNNTGQIYLVNAYRYPSKSWGWELPGGSADGENPVEASRRELQEETGLQSDDWHVIGSPLVCNGLMNERMNVVAALNVRPGTATETEEVFSDQRFFSAEEISAMASSGEIDDAQTMACLYIYLTWRQKGIK